VEKNRFDRIDAQLERIVDKQIETTIVLAENTQSLIIHEKRTDIAERKLSLLELEFKTYAEREKITLESIQAKLNPIHTHVTIVNVLVKYIIPAAGGILIFLYKMGVFK
jgi:hypothetical protein